MVGKQENLVALRGAGARRLAKTETGSARTSERNRTRVARRGSAIAPWFPGQVAEKKMRVARNPNCGTSGAEWKGRGLDQGLWDAATRFPKNHAPESIAATPDFGRSDCNEYRVGRKREGKWKLLRTACRDRGESQSSRDSRHELVCAVGHGRWSYRTNTSDRGEWSLPHTPPSQSLGCNSSQKVG